MIKIASGRLSVTALLFFLSVMLPQSSYAAREKGQVHFEPFEYSVPAINDFVYFTLFVVPSKQSHLLDLCKMEPRVRDVVNNIMHGRKGIEKMGLKNRHMIKASEVMKLRINKALGVDWVEIAYFVRGAIDTGSGSIENPTIPNPLSCPQIYFRAKSISNPDD